MSTNMHQFAVLDQSKEIDIHLFCENVVLFSVMTVKEINNVVIHVLLFCCLFP